MREPYRRKAIRREPIIFKELVGKQIIPPDQKYKSLAHPAETLYILGLVVMRGLRALHRAEQDTLVDRLLRFIKGGSDMVKKILSYPGVMNALVVLGCMSFIGGYIIDDPRISILLQAIARALP